MADTEFVWLDPFAGRQPNVWDRQTGNHSQLRSINEAPSLEVMLNLAVDKAVDEAGHAVFVKHLS
jgi:hypothetical protein